MATYRVECVGEVREVYMVEADSEEEAVANWSNGALYLSEASSMEGISAELEDDR
jgi:hypothetical protein